jgi:uncharacterized protein (TIGR00251 family)
MMYPKTILLIKLTPGGSANKIVSYETDLLGDRILKVMVTAIPEKGQANKALFKLLSKSFKLPLSAFSIVRGDLSRTKMLEVDCDLVTLEEKIKVVGVGG